MGNRQRGEGLSLQLAFIPMTGCHTVGNSGLQLGDRCPVCPGQPLSMPIVDALTPHHSLEGPVWIVKYMAPPILMDRAKGRD